MIGDPAVSFFATAYNKGIRNYDADLAYEGLRKNAFPGGIRDHAGYEHSKDAHSGGMEYYIKMGYVPDGRANVVGMHTTGASMTLEYAYQDWCLAQMAKAMASKLIMNCSLNAQKIIRTFGIKHQDSCNLKGRMENGYLISIHLS